VEVLQPTTSALYSAEAKSSDNQTKPVDRAIDLFSFPVGLVSDPIHRDARGSFDLDDPASPVASLKSSPGIAISSFGDFQEGEVEERRPRTESDVRIPTLDTAVGYEALLDADSESIQSVVRKSSIIIWHGVIESGSHQNLEAARLDRSLYVRIRLAPGGRWSELIKIPTRAHLDRPYFNQELPLPVFQGGKSAHDDYADVKLVRRWRFKSTRRLFFFAEYWLVNRTGLALGYKPLSSSNRVSTSDGQGEPQVGVKPSHSEAGLWDKWHITRFGTRLDMPVLMSCPNKTMGLMPYAMANQATTPGFFISELRLGSSRVNYLSTGFNKGSKIYADSDMAVMDLPPTLASAPLLYAVITCRQREVNADKEEDILTFRLSADAHVMVCLTEHQQCPDWLTCGGFRSTSEAITLSGATSKYLVYRRFYSGGSKVVLGGVRESGRLSPTPGEASSTEKAVTRPRYPCESSFFVLIDNHEASNVDVQDVKVNRDFGDRLFCHQRYAILPNFQAGDRMYVDREYTVGALPDCLAGKRVVAILTAQGDRKASAGFMLTFTVKRPCVVFLAYDSRAKTRPLWVKGLGFRGTKLSIPGVDHDYQLHELPLSEGTVLRLGPNIGPGASGTKRMYFVIVSEDYDSENGGSGCGHLDRQTSTITQEEEAALVSEIERGRRAGGGQADQEDVGIWDDRSGHLALSTPLFDEAGRDWSPPFNVDAINTKGQVETSCAVLGVSIAPLTGIFHRTKVVTLCPRFIVVNQTDHTFEILPTVRMVLPSLTMKARVGAIIPALANELRGRQRSQSPITINPFLSEGTCIETLSSAQSLALYSFVPLRFLPPGVRIPWMTDVEANSDVALTWNTTIPGEKERILRRCISLRLSGYGDVPFSQPIMVEEVGETCVWAWLDTDGVMKGPLISVTVSIEEATMFVIIKVCTSTPPYQIENR